MPFTQITSDHTLEKPPSSVESRRDAWLCGHTYLREDRASLARCPSLFQVRRRDRLDYHVFQQNRGGKSKDEGLQGEKLAAKLGGVVVRNGQSQDAHLEASCELFRLVEVLLVFSPQVTQITSDHTDKAHK